MKIEATLPASVTVGLGERAYDITLDHEIAAPLLPAGIASGARRMLIVSDTNVAPLYAGKVEEALKRDGASVASVVVPAGEASKSVERVAELWSAAVHMGLDRGGVMVALGGGVVGDLAGFAASTYLRGVRFIQVPTTLLAMVDSSVGGKTGINLPEGKNLAGAFHQPVAVRIALSTLDTLPRREFAAGMAEVIKYGAIWDESFLAFLEMHAQELLSERPDRSLMGAIVAHCCRIKAEVVEADEREGGLRAILNFGHTMGHALENTLGYGGWLHGEAISLGMVYAALIGERTGLCPVGLAQRLAALLARFGLPVERARLVLDFRGSEPRWEDLRKAMSSDKKSRSGLPRFVLCDRPGHARFGVEVQESKLREVWDNMR